MSAKEPPWVSERPEGWSTFWAAYYRIADAPPVCVDYYVRGEKAAVTAAEEALAEALKKVAELGLRVEASCWTVKHRSRRQTQKFDPANVKEYVTANWHGRITQVLKAIHEAEAAS